ncbi:MAG: restriction endonuclease subunit S [Bacteroidia bacterium]
MLKKGEFAYNKSYSLGYPMGAFKRLDNYNHAVVTTLYICFELKANCNSDFVLRYFEGGRVVQGLMRIAQEGGRAHGLLNISLKDFFELKLILPPLPEQQAIASVLSAAEAEVAVQERRLAQLEEQKKGLMQQLLTGAKRVTI